MADKKYGGKGKSGDADFGRGTKKIPEQEYTKVVEGTAPSVEGGSKEAQITDKTS